MTALLFVFACFGFCLFISNIHEASHWLADRLLGVPASKIKIVLDAAPPHVALRDGSTWISPDNPRYVFVFQKFRADARSGWLFSAGGFLLETCVTGTLTVLIALQSLTPALILAVLSLVLFVIYISSDIFLTQRRRKPYGDFGAMMRCHGAASVVFLTVASLIKLLLLYALALSI